MKTENVCYCCKKVVLPQDSVTIDGKIVCITHKGVDIYATTEYLKKQQEKIKKAEKKGFVVVPGLSPIK